MIAWLIVTFGVGLGLTLLGVKFWRRADLIQKAAVTWPTTMGAITKAEYGINLATTENSTESRYLQIFYSYTVDGTNYSRNVKIGDSSRDYIDGPAKYPVGPIEIKYNPLKPKSSAFDISLIEEGRAISIWCFIFAFLAWIFFITGVYMVIKGH